MIAVITGGSASGKSQIAEDMIVSLAGGNEMYYIATMLSGNDKENLERIQKHRKNRSGKGFETIECYRDIEKSVHYMYDPERGESSLRSRLESTPEKRKKVALLECVSNLTANEMFGGGTVKNGEDVACKVTEGIKKLSEEVDVLVIVTNTVFEDGIQYDGTTTDYLRALGKVNRNIFAMADEAYEAVAGIAVRLK